ncbi:tRNA(adenine34) deaminase [Deinobacterium chartae]|uniref:tRNA(Adenine34) deaminase n=1 Tax=Deinobacterium chartae TaxID=521158 RepID=A0A841I1R9_9DEIO|nr:nucleoside deaminase [Deinobacterium chartae]MBB6098370.1 tRNA(adenine34) deaminase [Deinobacterium chartae]
MDSKRQLRSYDRRLLEETLTLARRSAEIGSAPVGAVLADSDGTVLARGRNRVAEPWDLRERRIGDASFAHAEMDLYFQLGRLDSERVRGYTLYTSLEPCLMCGGATGMIGVGRIVWATDDPWGGSGRLIRWNEHPAFVQVEVLPCPYEDLEREGARLFAPEAKRAYPEVGWALWRERYPEFAAAVDRGERSGNRE